MRSGKVPPPQASRGQLHVQVILSLSPWDQHLPVLAPQSTQTSALSAGEVALGRFERRKQQGGSHNAVYYFDFNSWGRNSWDKSRAHCPAICNLTVSQCNFLSQQLLLHFSTYSWSWLFTYPLVSALSANWSTMKLRHWASKIFLSNF